jgi:phospholipase/carboxylesterase
MSESLGFIHRYVPAGDAHRSAPALLLLHGTGGNEDDLLDLGRSLFPGAPLLSPRGKVLENGMPRFFRRLSEGVFDEEDLIRRTHELADFVLAAADEYRWGGRRVVAIGYSNGANIAASTLLLRPSVLAGAVLLRAMVPLSPATAPALDGVKVFLASGRQDSLVHPASPTALAAMLTQAGADVSLRWSEAGHQLESSELDAARQWLAGHFS